MSLEFDIRDFLKESTRAVEQIENKAIPAALAKVSGEIIDEAQQLVPVKTGKLRDSLNYKLDPQAKQPTSILGSDVEYALVVHEDLQAFHPQGGPKFLERPLLRAGDKLTEAITIEMAKVR